MDKNIYDKGTNYGQKLANSIRLDIINSVDCFTNVPLLNEKPLKCYGFYMFRVVLWAPAVTVRGCLYGTINFKQ